MNQRDQFPSQDETPPRIPIWKQLLLIATMLVAALCLFAFNAHIGGALFIAGIFFQTCGGFAAQPGIPGETRLRVVNFVSAWIVCVLLAAGLQSIIPLFAGVHASFGSALPVATALTNKIYPLTLLAPLLVGIVWHFWPKRIQRLRVAVTLSWASNALMAMMFGSMYLPLWAI